MSNSSNDSERLRRIREQQLQARDPQKKQRKIQGRVSSQYRSRQKYTVKDGVRDIHHKWKGLFIGLFIGVIIWVLLVAFVEKTWVDLVGILAVLAFAIIGFIYGSSLDWRDDIRDV